VTLQPSAKAGCPLESIGQTGAALRSTRIVQVCYHELTYTTKEYMSCVSAVDPLWLAELVRRACGELTASLMASYSSRKFSLAFLGFRLVRRIESIRFDWGHVRSQPLTLLCNVHRGRCSFR
jgi:hypothetical protein